MKKNNAGLLPLLLVFAFLGMKDSTNAQISINPYIGYAITSLEYTTNTGSPIPGEEFLTSTNYSPSPYGGFAIIMPINEYWEIDVQSDVSHQKISQQDNSFSGRIGAYFWQFRNSIIPKVFVSENWRLGIGLNIDYMTSNHSSFDQMKDRLDVGGTFQIDYQLNKQFNVHLNYRRTIKVIDIDTNIRTPLQSLNLGLGYRFQIKKK